MGQDTAGNAGGRVAFSRPVLNRIGRSDPWRLGIWTALALRAGVSGMMLLSWMAVRSYLEPILNARPPGVLALPHYHFPLDGLISIWVRWDAYRYVGLAITGYGNPVVPGDTVFYPLLPLLMRWTGQLFRMDVTLAGLLLSTLFTAVTFALLYQLADETFGPETAQWSVAALAIYPTSFFLVGPYTESLFLAFTLAVFLLARRERWLLAGLMAALASLARGPGVYTAAALAWIAFMQIRKARNTNALGLTRKQLLQMSAGISLPVAAAAGFLAWRHFAGFAPVTDLLVQYFGVRMTNPISALANAWGLMFTAPTFTVVMEGVTAVLWLGLMAAMLASRRRGGDGVVPVEWLIYMGLNLLMFFSKETTIISPLQSLGRYVLALFPGFIYTGAQLAKSGPRRRLLYVGASASLLMIFCALYVIGFFVG